MLMSPIGDVPASSKDALQSMAWRSRALQKPKAASDLHGNQQDETPPRQEFRGAHAAAAVVCSGTEEAVPFRYAPRLVSPFVAQLLGQLLPNPEIPASQARTAYGTQESQTSLLLDTRL